MRVEDLLEIGSGQCDQSTVASCTRLDNDGFFTITQGLIKVNFEFPEEDLGVLQAAAQYVAEFNALHK